MLDQVTVENYKNIAAELNASTPRRLQELATWQAAYFVPDHEMQFLGIINLNPENGPFGNHYHEYKNEVLYVISGEVIGYYWDPHSPNDLNRLHHKQGDKIIIPPMVGHSFEANQPSILLEVSTTPLDLKDTIYQLR